MRLQLFGINFHLYGFIVGISASLGVVIAEKLAKKENISENTFWKIVVAAVLGGILGARFYHVYTDWNLYQDQLQNIVKVWQGGLSIIGAFIGGAVGIILATFWIDRTRTTSSKQRENILLFADITALSLPISQAVGRLANFVNQELYGWPTDLPWAIPIDLNHRVTGYEAFEKFHPLFAYEAIGMLVCAAVLWTLYRRGVWKIGSGNFVLLYFGWYGVFRALLEFLRIEKTTLLNTSFGLNQTVLFIVGLLCMTALALRVKKKNTPSLKVFLMIGVVCAAFGFSGCSLFPQKQQTFLSYSDLLKKRDYTLQEIRIFREGSDTAVTAKVELVTSHEAQTKGLAERDSLGSEGMLFVLKEKALHGIWMKGMRFDIDIVWIADGKIVGITSPVKDPEGDSPGPSYYPPESVNMILELPVGMSSTWQLQVGDRFEVL